MNQYKGLVASVISVGVMTLFPIAGRAEDPPPISTLSKPATSNPNPESMPAFGKRGQWYLMAPNIWGSRDHNDASSSNSMPSSHFFAAEMAFGTFVRDHFSLGMDVGGSYNSTEVRQDPSAPTESFTGWGLGGHFVAGWQRAVSPWFSFWPSLTLGGAHLQQDLATYDAAGTTTKGNLGINIIDAAVQLPLILHATRHFFVDIMWSMRLSSRWAEGNTVHANSVTSVGLGGWL